MTDADTISVGIQFPTVRHAERTAQVHRLTTARLMFTSRPVAFVHGVERKRRRTRMPNQSRQPTPGERLGSNRTRLARRGCAHR
jgi:hypothetical protein